VIKRNNKTSVKGSEVRMDKLSAKNRYSLTISL